MEEKNATNLDSQPKMVLGFLIVIGIITIILGFWRLNNYLKTPFIINYQTTVADLKERLTNIRSSTISKFTDTDHDGLTDYDELNIYKTSPYLEDSDSDGDEIAQNKNPNCPEGQNCITYANLNNNVNINGLLQNYPDLTGQENVAQIIRQSLLASGVSEQELAQVDDATLIQLYLETAQEEEGFQNANLSMPAGLTKEQLANFNVEQIKQVLISNGVNEDDLKQLSDEQIMAAWQEVIKTL